MFKTILSTLIFSSMAWAGGGVVIDGGGGGVEIDGKIYLSDFYEMGNYKSGGTTPSYSADPSIYAALKKIQGFSLVSDETLQQLTVRITAIEAMDVIFGQAIYEGIKLLNWNFTSASLIQTDDTKLCPVDLPVMQLAVRQGNTVSVSQELFKRMDHRNQVGLIIHEAVHALAPSELGSSCHRRRVVASLFNADFLEDTSSDFRREYLKGFPTTFEAKSRNYFPLLGNDKSYYRTNFMVKGFPYLEDMEKSSERLSMIRIPTLLLPYATIQGLGKNQSPLQTVSIDALNEDLCDGRHSASTIQIYHMVVTLLPQWSEKGEFLATFAWKLEPQTFYGGFKMITGSNKTCSASDRLYLQAIKQWREYFMPILTEDADDICDIMPGYCP